MKLWDKGLDIDKKIEQFTVGNDREIDIHIAKYDIQASVAHAKMLESVGLISKDELQLLQQQFKVMAEQVKNGEFKIESQFEDVHSKIEFELIQKLGDVGRKIHTARSRNDQVLVALHLYYREQLQQIKTLSNEFFKTLLNLAEKYKDKVLPGYTHLQVAMPSSFGLWFSAYAEQLIDDMYMLDAAIKTVDQNPLGSAAGYGSSFAINRNITTRELGFSTLKYNVVAAQMSRGKSERTIASVLGSICNTLSRFAMDICLYTSQNFDFICFPDQLTTGSSIMPHKKNPDVFELIRGKSNKIQALHLEMLLITNNLPSGYHRDYQLLKENMISGIQECTSILEIFNYSIKQIQVKTVDIRDPKYLYMYSVDQINALVEQGISFREAYQKISEQVQSGTYKSGQSKPHTHSGSMGNLCLEDIRKKFPN
ncbi:argininosuccinate lyase [Psychroflexus sp. CAK8W]|uniref:Argininosuccinate lyase n=1 Tax=Psychroflexus longus TaxID=2873596 RepID=A0ABS7XHG3_9FLAO|nr:argininosuccinate lyase [Psychroflexus longus]MBZ9778395.1 argininosuccinate lyase [Psychroflexus longus]